MKGWRVRRIIVPGAVFVLAMLLRLVYVHQIRDNPFFDSPVVDAQTYDNHALEIARGNWLGDHVFYQAPLYAYFLALINLALGHDYLMVRIVQAVLGALNCLLTFLLARRVFGPKVAAVSGFAAAAYGVLIFFDAELLRPVMIIFLILLLLLALLRAAGGTRAGRWAAAGLIAGLGAITQENVLLFVPAALAWLAFTVPAPRSWGAISRASAAFLLAMAAVVLPVTARNWVVSGDIVLISSQGGLNFYIGNNPEMERTTTLQPGAGWEELASLPSRKAGLWRSSEQSRWFYARSFEFIREHPVEELVLLLRKAGRFVNGYELTPDNDLDYYRERSSLLRFLVRTGRPVAVPFGLVAPLALLGMFLAGVRRRRVLLLQAFVLAYSAAVIPFQVLSRYRLPVVPVLLIFAAYAVCRLASLLRRRGGQEIVRPLLLLIFLFVLANADFQNLRQSPRRPMHFFEGLAYEQRGHLDAAIREMEEAARLDPNNADVANNLGIIYQKAGRSGDALAAYLKAVSLAPNSRAPLNNLGHYYLEAGDPRKAMPCLEKAVNIDISYGQAWNNLGRAYLALGQNEAAESSFRAAVRADPGYASARYNLGLALAGAGRLPEAVAELDAAARLAPDDAEIGRTLAAARRGLERRGPR